jgi:hypothetical protein
MPPSDPFSPAQLVGYLAFVLGVVSFLQRDDRRLRAMIAAQSFSYCVHFFLLGSTVGALASLVTCTRALVSLVTRSTTIGIAILAVNMVLGIFWAGSNAVAWLPVLGTTAGTVAFFWFDGLPMRFILLGATAAWLANNLWLGSIGGSMLEALVGVANGVTCYRLWRARARELEADAKARA